MQAVVEYLFGAASFVPHGFCLLWRPDLVALHAGADLVIALAYFSIPLGMFIVQRRRHDLPFRGMFRLSALFIVACGIGHLIDVFTLWYPAYGLQGLVKAVTAVISAITAVALWPMIPRVMALPSPATLEEANTQLRAEVAERRQTEAELMVARSVAEEIGHTKSAFLASMSHELRTPLTAVLGMADLLADEHLDENASRYVAAIRRSGRQLLAIVNDILDFQRLEAGRLPLHEIDFKLDEVLEDVRSAMLPMAHERSVILTVAPPADIVVRGDAVRLKQILFNLVGNALKFTMRGRVDVLVELEDRPQGGLNLCIEVRDTGIGISTQDLGLLFQPFMQADGSTSRRFGGTGLGLTICKQLVLLMGGSITCESRPGEGSTFRFEVPLARGKVPVPLRSGASTAAEAPLDILLAEDALLNRQLLADVLGRRGHRLVVAEHGAEFLERASERRFDVLLVDIQMPVLGGEEAIRDLRRGDGPNRDTPAVALTANVMDDDRARYLRAGFDAVQHKPIAPGELFATLASLAQSGRARRAATEADVRGSVGMAAGDEQGVTPEVAPAVDWSFVAMVLESMPPAAARDFLVRALADAREGLGDFGDPSLGADGQRRLAHRLKGTARSFGLVAVGDAAEAVEHAAKDGLDIQSSLARYLAALDATARELATPHAPA
jgi:signal transduction histidine kinase/DNA-binding NarL/FixJ family response regulator